MGIGCVRTLFVLIVACALFGCSSLTGRFGLETHVKLYKKNFQVVKTNVRGESTGFALLAGLIPIVPATYTQALNNLHEAANMEGKATALVNMAEDATQLNLLLFSVPRVTITADVIEFTQ